MTMGDDHDLLQKTCTTVFCQEFSPDGSVLVAGDNGGRVFVYTQPVNVLVAIDSHNRCVGATRLSQHEEWKIERIVSVTKGWPIYCMQSTDQFLLCGCGDGTVRGFDWSDLTRASIRERFCIRLDVQGPDNMPCEINDMALTSDGTELVLATGDTKIYNCTIEGGRLQGCLNGNGHTDYVHAVCVSGDTCFSGSEDGHVIQWDLRNREQTYSFEPSSVSKLARPLFGEQVSCLVADNDWLLIGGAPRLSLWHIPSRTMAVAFDTTCTTNVVRFHEDKVYSAGMESSAACWLRSGEQVSNVATTIPCIYDLAISSCRERQILTVSGTHTNIDVLLDLSYAAAHFTTLANPI